MNVEHSKIYGLAMCVVLVTLPGAGPRRDSTTPVMVQETCRTGQGTLHAAPDGPFSVLVTCEGALGIYLSVVYTGAMGAPAEGVWKIGERFWYEDSWGDDVTSYVWDSAGGRLYVATSGTYGTGCVYLLELRQRISRRLLGADEQSENSFEIEKLDEKRMKLEVAQEDKDGLRTRLVVRLAGADSLAKAKP